MEETIATIKVGPSLPNQTQTQGKHLFYSLTIVELVFYERSLAVCCLMGLGWEPGRAIVTES